MVKDSRSRARLVWHCSSCGKVTAVDPPYSAGDSEPCVYCPIGTATVVAERPKDRVARSSGQGVRRVRSCR